MSAQWSPNPDAQVPTDTLEHATMDAIANVSELPDGTWVVSVSVHARVDSDRAHKLGEALLADVAHVGIAK